MANVYMGTDVEDFIFGESTYEEAEEKIEKEEAELMESIQAEMDATGIRECVDEPEVACYCIALENEQNYNTIMNAFMMKEFTVLESTGHEMVYEAADGKKFFDKIQDMILRFWQKIKGVFKTVNAKIAQYVATNKAFVDKYKDAKFVKPSKPFTGYEFGKLKVAGMKNYAEIVDVIPVNPGFAAMNSTECDVWLDKQDGLDKVKEKMRNAACYGKPATNDFSHALKIQYYGSEKKKTVDLIDFETLMTELTYAKSARKAVKEQYKVIEEGVKKQLKQIKDAKKEIERKDGDRSAKMKVARYITDCMSAALNIMSTTFSVHTRALTAKMMQDRAMVTFYALHQPKATKVKESAVEDDLGIVLI